MRDFRRLRDAALMTERATLLDAAPSNRKLDLNQNGQLEVNTFWGGDPIGMAFELYPRSLLTRRRANAIAVRMRLLDEQLSSVEVLARAYQPDPVQPWPASALARLTTSADLHFLDAETGAIQQRFGATRIEIVEIRGELAPGDQAPGDLSALSGLTVDDRRDMVLTTPLRRNIRVAWQPICAGGSGNGEGPYETAVGDLDPGGDAIVRLAPPACARDCAGNLPAPCTAQPDAGVPDAPPGGDAGAPGGGAGGSTSITHVTTITIEADPSLNERHTRVVTVFDELPLHWRFEADGPDFPRFEDWVRVDRPSTDPVLVWCTWERRWRDPGGDEHTDCIRQDPPLPDTIQYHCFHGMDHMGHSGVRYVDEEELQPGVIQRIEHTCSGPGCTPAELTRVCPP
jgi:hypothetical protein